MKRVIACLVLFATRLSFAGDPPGGIAIDASRLGGASRHAPATATQVAARKPRLARNDVAVAAALLLSGADDKQVFARLDGAIMTRK